ncbi:serine/threonine-protein kinase [Streptomyces sp. NRRL S-340]|uniref:serine/threonine-protein kinase n=1 Tax=Streptomyces sp. NRRL S-340 TaxID=1463901 RepID=UPI0005633759|nr:serine/threonine-protein kinase [Streptomyces sp. NRRL S-340]
MGEVFAGRYELADPIGHGGVGAVWRAWDHRRHRYVAAKVLRQSDAHALLRFVREQALRIDHPHVLAPASWAADDDKVLFTMDLVAGGSLVHLVGDYGPLPAGFVCILLDQLLAGLAAVHAEQVVHRDIKPANILLEATGTGRPRLRLSDFGIAMRLGEPRLTETNLVVGTPGYLAPEQMTGAEPDFPADLFATGLVALYLLQGARPDARALVEHFVEHGTPGAPQGVPEPLWQVVAGLLQPDPRARFRTATGARKALASAVELLPEPGPDDEPIEIFDQLGPLPPGFGPDGPVGPGHPHDLDHPHGLERPHHRERPHPTGRSEATGGLLAHTPAAAPGPEPAPAQTSGPAPGSPPGSGAGSAAPAAARSPRDARPPAPGQTGPAAASDTGSFPLPPPLPRPSAAAADGTPPAPPPPVTGAPAAPVSSHDPTHVLLPSPGPHAPRPSAGPVAPATRRRADASTASYTAQPPRVPGPARAVSRHRAVRPRRPGPPPAVAVPLLLLALACYAVGLWALVRL